MITRSNPQLIFPTLAGEIVAVPQFGKHHIQQRGYAAKPGTGPKGETCGSCKHIRRGRRYRKCELTRACWTHSQRTDILARAPACAKWEGA